MAHPDTRQTAISISAPYALRASVEPIAAQLARSLGASSCYVKLAGTVGRRPRLLGFTSEGDAGGLLPSDIAQLLRKVRGRAHPLVVPLGDHTAVAVSMHYDARLVGTALLLLPGGSPVDLARVTAAADLAARALDAERQVAALHLQAEEIEARAHLREIQVSRNLIRGVIDTIPMGLALIDADGTVLAANRALAERFDLDPAALVGMAYGDTIGPWRSAPAFEAFASGCPGSARRTMAGRDGRETLLEIASIPLFDFDGRAQQVVEIWEDITERVALQTQLVRVEKLAAIGQLAASIAHEVGNPLQAIQGFLALFLEQCDPETPNRRFLELAEDEIERIVQVLARLRDLYRPRADVVAPLNVNDLVEHVLLLTNKQLERSRVKVLRELDPTLPEITGVADQLKQVLLNLVLNAVEAMDGGGILHVQTLSHAQDGACTAVEVAITDTGAGIPNDWQPRIFDGLHTTKERGMGLGLYTSKAIVERHMGRIAVQSTPGEGTTFTITLPLGSQEASQ